MKKVFFLFSVLFSVISIHAQTDTARFLWFTGHWSSDKKTFITASRTDTTDAGNVVLIPGGNKITITPGGDIRVKGKSTDDWNKKIDEGLQNLQKEEDAEGLSTTSPVMWTYHLAKLVKPESDSLKSSFKQLKIDNKQNNDSREQQAMQKLVKDLANWCAATKPKYDAVMAFYHAHHKVNDPLNNPTPPEDDYSCISCDTTLAKRNAEKREAYVNDFFKPESDYIKDVLDMLKTLTFLGRYTSDLGDPTINTFSELDPLFHYSSKDPTSNGACSYFYQDTHLDDVLYWLVWRCMDRAEKLRRDYRNNVKTLFTVTKVCLNACKQASLLGVGNEDKMIAELGGMFSSSVSSYLDTLERKHDWSQLSNIPFILNLARQSSLLGGSDLDAASRIYKVLNSFYLNLEMDTKAGKNGGYILAHLKGKAKITINFDFDADNCKNWVVIEDQPGLAGQPVLKKDPKVEMDLLANEMIVPQGPRPTYIGTKKYFTLLQNLKMDFCHPGSDTILLTAFSPSPDLNAGMWNIPYSQPAPSGIHGLDGYFRDVNYIQKVAQSGELKQEAYIDKAKEEELLAKVKALQSQIGSDRKNPQNLDKYMQLRDLAKQTQTAFNGKATAAVLYIPFALPIQNMNKVLVEKRFDAKEINTKVADAGAIVYGYYTVKIEYNP